MKKPKNKLLLLLPVLGLTAFAFQNKSKPDLKKVQVSGTVMHTGAYCGGAKPSDEMLAQISDPRPFASKKLYVKKGKLNDFSQAPLLEFISDSAGKFSIMLPPGEYCIVDAFKKNKSNYDEVLKKYAKETKDYSAVDKNCLTQWFQSPDAVLMVAKTGVKNFTITFADKCPWNAVPCVTYRGPLPP